MTPGPWEILIIALVVVLLFGAKKLPDAARSIGRSMRIFKSEVSEMGKDNENQSQQQAPQTPPREITQNPNAASEQQYNPQQGFQNPPQQQQPHDPNNQQQ